MIKNIYIGDRVKTICSECEKEIKTINHRCNFGGGRIKKLNKTPEKRMLNQINSGVRHIMPNFKIALQSGEKLR